MENGTFKSVKGDDFVKYLIQLGTPKEEAEKLKGSTWRMRVSVEEGGKYVTVLTCDEMPELNNVDTFYENREKEEAYHPLFGGKVKMIFERTGRDSYKGTAQTEKYGLIEWTEKYSDAGLAVSSHAKTSGATLTEFWTREIKETGWFKYSKDENLVNFMVASGVVSAEEASSAKDVVVHLDFVGDTYILTEIWGGVKNVTRFKLDEETNYSFPGMPAMDRKFIQTRTGVGKMKSIQIGKNGEKEEWDWEFSDKGLLWIGLDKKTGQSCKIWYESFVNINGCYRPIATSGYPEFGAAVGMPSELATKMANELDAKLTLEEKDGFVHCKYVSKFMPSDLVFKYNEEFEYSAPGMPGTYKCIETRHGDTMINVSKGPKYTMRTTVKFTEHFAIQTTNIVGTDISTKVIMERI